MNDKTKTPAAPAGLGVRGKRFWKTTVDDYELTASELLILTETCRTIDDLDALAAVIRENGPVVEGSAGQQVVNGAMTEARGQRLALHRLLAALGLEDAETGDVVPSARSIRAQHAAQTRWRGHVKDGA